MPCQSYDDDWNRGDDDRRKIRELKKQTDMLARIACKALSELEANGIEDLILLKDDEVRTWWKKHKEDDAREQARLAEIERKERIKAEALASLSEEAKELLGLTNPPPKKKSSKVVDAIDEEDEDALWEIDEVYDDYKLSDGTTIRTFKVR